MFLAQVYIHYQCVGTTLRNSEKEQSCKCLHQLNQTEFKQFIIEQYMELSLYFYPILLKCSVIKVSQDTLGQSIAA